MPPDALHVAPEGAAEVLEAFSDDGDYVNRGVVTAESVQAVLAAYHAATAPRWERMMEAMRNAPTPADHSCLSTECDTCWASMDDTDIWRPVRESWAAMCRELRILPVFLFGVIAGIRIEASWTGLAWCIAAAYYVKWLRKKGHIA